LGNRKGIQPVKKLGVGLLVVMIWLELCATYSSGCCRHLPSSFASINAGWLSSPGGWPLKNMVAIVQMWHLANF